MENVDQGYHVYVVVWEVVIGQILPCQWEVGNIYNVHDH